MYMHRSHHPRQTCLPHLLQSSALVAPEECSYTVSQHITNLALLEVAIRRCLGRNRKGHAAVALQQVV